MAAEQVNNLTDKKEIITNAFRMWIDADGIVTIISLLKTEGTLDDARETHANVIKLANGKKRPILINPAEQKSITREARIYSVKNAPDLATAIAILITSPVALIIANLLITLNKTINQENPPLRFFTSEKKAVEWLKKYVL